MNVRAPNVLFLLAALAALPPGCGRGDAGGSSGRPRLVLGIVGKSQSNPVFQAAHRGAKAAAERLSAERGVDIEVRILTPPDEDPQEQARAIEQLARAGAQGIAVSCSDANTLTAAIDRAVELGAHVVCFDSDAPRSRRFAFFGTDDISCGELVMRHLAEAMGGKGVVAILAGNQTAPNLQKRVEGVKRELARHPDMRLLEDGVFWHPETPEKAAETVNRAQSTHPEIEGWAMVGGWPLFTRDALRWEPGAVKVVAVDALPAQLRYLESGHVAVLLAQNCFGWGEKSVEFLVDKILDGKDPEGGPRIVDPLVPVRRADVDEWRRKWARWLGG